MESLSGSPIRMLRPPPMKINPILMATKPYGVIYMTEKIMCVE